MKRLVISILVLVGMIGVADAATRPTGGVNSRSGGTSAPAPSVSSSARSAVSARSAKPTAAPAATTNTAQRTTVQRGQQPASSGTTANVGRSATVSARAGATQKVINTGTKVAAAAQNTVVSDACRQKYEGCMDSFCMLDNANGGRCICSDRNAELNAALAEIEKLDQQSYQMATFGVERIEMGADAEQAIANANAAAQSVINAQADDKKTSTARRSLDLSMWNTSIDFDADDIFGSATDDPIEGKEGDALHRAAADICFAQMPECAAEKSLLQMMYSQSIKSDCTAYENSLKQQKNASQQKLMAAEQALREAALEQLRTANKYDLGQCTVEFKKCMITTGGCGDDFSQCASVVAIDSTNSRFADSKKPTYKIKGSATTIEISASTYDTLEAKKPLCANITNSCVAVKDQVWDTFLREVAPQIKNAELIAEDNARQNCIGNISSCFQTACKDTMDPNDPDGSYDMCLSRPETMLNLCKIPLDACGVNTTSADTAKDSQIWDFVKARLSAMRVDSCTTEVKQCLQADDRCGKDYSNCIGLDTDTIVRMCPYDKLTGCQDSMKRHKNDKGEYDFEDDLYSMIQGIILNVDNSMLTECQRAADEAMIRVCGDTENCNGIAIDETTGTRSLEYQICEANTNTCYTNTSQIPDSKLGRSTDGSSGTATQFQTKISGEIPWDKLEIDTDGKLKSDSFAKITDDKAKSELSVIANSINMAIQAIESDTKVQFCETGRTVQTSRSSQSSSTTTSPTMGRNEGRFANLTTQMRGIIATSAIAVARENYNKKYSEINKSISDDMITLAERIAKNKGENALDARREIARQACVNYGQVSGIGVGGNSNNTHATDLVGSTFVNTKSYKETITSTFNWETLVCHRCIRKQPCAKMKGSNCRTWGDESETCSDIQF